MWEESLILHSQSKNPNWYFPITDNCEGNIFHDGYVIGCKKNVAIYKMHIFESQINGVYLTSTLSSTANIKMQECVA